MLRWAQVAEIVVNSASTGGTRGISAAGLCSWGYTHISDILNGAKSITSRRTEGYSLDFRSVAVFVNIASIFINFCSVIYCNLKMLWKLMLILTYTDMNNGYNLQDL